MFTSNTKYLKIPTSLVTLYEDKNSCSTYEIIDYYFNINGIT